MGWACLAYLSGLIAMAGGQDGEGSAVAAGTSVNVFVVTDKGHMVSKKSIEVAMDYLTKNTAMGVNIGKKIMAEATGTDAYDSVEKICADLDSMIDAGTPPDIVIDTTRAGIASEVVKTLTLTLGLPTVTATYGEKGDIRDWRDLTPSQQKYLIQVRPPGDLIPDILRELILMQNITNAGILYDDTFVMDKKYKSLLLNVPCRHIINKIKMSDMDLKKQLTRLDEVDINNYFILGSAKTIKRVYDMGNSMKLYGEKYAWFAGTKDSDAEFDASCCNDMKVAFFSPTPTSSSTMRTYKDNYGLTMMPEIDAAFYFSLATRSIKAVKDMKAAGTWPEINYVKCSDYKEPTPIARDIDLVTAFKAVAGEDLYGPMMLKENGMSYMEFNLNVITYEILNKKIANRKEVGSFAVGTPGMMKFKSGMESALAGFAATTVYRVVTVIQPPFIMRNDGKDKYYNKNHQNQDTYYYENHDDALDQIEHLERWINSTTP